MVFGTQFHAGTAAGPCGCCRPGLGRAGLVRSKSLMRLPCNCLAPVPRHSWTEASALREATVGHPGAKRKIAGVLRRSGSMHGDETLHRFARVTILCSWRSIAGAGSMVVPVPVVIHPLPHASILFPHAGIAKGTADCVHRFQCGAARELAFANKVEIAFYASHASYSKHPSMEHHLH